HANASCRSRYLAAFRQRAIAPTRRRPGGKGTYSNAPGPRNTAIVFAGREGVGGQLASVDAVDANARCRCIDSPARGGAYRSCLGVGAHASRGAVVRRIVESLAGGMSSGVLVHDRAASIV